MINIADGENSYDCQEGSRFPSADNYLYFPDNIVYCQEGAEMTQSREEKLKYFRRRNYACKEELAANAHQRWLKKHPIPTIIEHHTKYKEIDGIDETEFILAGEHKKIHNKLRHEGKSAIPKEIVNRAQSRTEKRKAYLKSDKIKEWKKEYHSKNYNNFFFTETIGTNIRLIETIQCNDSTGTFTINSFFRADHGKKLLEVSP